ncbi:MAG: hypothetical protein WC146_03195 [Patescibacteria group bacterium]|jgi:hypothetical protein
MENEKKAKLTPVFSLLEKAVKEWWKNLKKFILVYFWGLLFSLLPVVFISILVLANSATSLGDSMIFVSISIFLGLWAMLFAFYFLIRTYLSMFLLLKKKYSGNELKIYNESSSYFWSYISLVILTLILLSLWFFALVIPAIVFSVFYSFAIFAFIFEDKKSMDAVNRSYELVRGYFWPVFGRILLLGLVLSLVTGVIALPLDYIKSNIWLNIWTIIVQVANLLLCPIALIFSFSIYKDLVKIKG